MTDEAPDTIPSPPSFAVAEIAARPSVLLVEDDEPLGRCLARMMREDGYQVVHAMTAEAAIESVRRRSFDMVLSDFNLPDSCGVDVLRVAREYDPEVPLMLMSGASKIDTNADAMSIGVLEYLVKPITSHNLARVLRRATCIRTGTPRRLLGDGPIDALWPELAAVDHGS
jgi:DNA-binding NtrC family response regulator